jgi:hypothetical protein
MNTPMLERLRKHLSCISADQFQSEWDAIEAMGFEGIPVEEFLKMLKITPSIAPIQSGSNYSSLIDAKYKLNPLVNQSFALAA